MSQPVLVRGELSNGFFWARILIPMCLLGTVSLLLFGDRTAGIVLTGVVGLMWIGLEAYAAIQRSKQVWIRDMGDGFDVIDRKQEFTVPDASVMSLAIKTKRNYAGGELKSIFRQYMVWTDEDPDPITLETTLTDKKPDPLEALTTRIWNRVVERTNAELQAGRSFSGDQWRVDKNSFTWGKPEQQQSVLRQDIAACEEFDGQICIWRKGQDDAVVKLPVAGRNVCLLPPLLQPAEQPADQAPAEDSGTLGRVLFERRPKTSTRVLIYAGGGLLCLVGLAMAVAADEIEVKLIGVGIGLVGLLCLVIAYSMAYTVFRCRERGVHKGGMFSQQELRYVDVGTFKYSATRHYHNGVYVGTQVAMNFAPLPEVKAPKISYSTTIMNEDSAIEELRNFIAKAIASRMGGRLSAGESVAWTSNLTFTPAGIQYRPQGFIGRKEAQLLPYAECSGHNMEQGVFYLFRKGEKKAVVSEQVGAANFFPGYFLLLMMQD